MTPLQCAGAPPPSPILLTSARCTHRHDPRHSGASDAVRFLSLADQTGTAIAQNNPQAASETLHPAPFYTYVHLAAETARTLRRRCSKWRLNTRNNYGTPAVQVMPVVMRTDYPPATSLHSFSQALLHRPVPHQKLLPSCCQCPAETPACQKAAFTFI